MAPWLRKLALTAHVTFSVSWLGAVAAFLLLAVKGLTSSDEQTVRAMYLSMDLVGWQVIVPLCFAALLTGLIEAFATPWGLFRHYWVLLKLAVTVLLTILLMLHIQPTRRLAAVAAETAISGPALHALQLQLAVDAGGALLGLVTVVALAIYKPRGVTRHGARKLGGDPLSARTPLWVKVFVTGRILSVIAVRALSGVHHGPGRHAGHIPAATTSTGLRSRSSRTARLAKAVEAVAEPLRSPRSRVEKQPAGMHVSAVAGNAGAASLRSSERSVVAEGDAQERCSAAAGEEERVGVAIERGRNAPATVAGMDKRAVDVYQPAVELHPQAGRVRRRLAREPRIADERRPVQRGDAKLATPERRLHLLRVKVERRVCAMS